MRTRNAVFSAVVAILLIGCLGFAIARFTSLLSGNPPERSYLEGREYQAIPQLTTNALSSKSFQDDVEQFIADSIPKRNQVILANSCIQRSLIKTASMPFGFDEYPTYFGANYAYSDKWESISELPYKRTAANESRLGEFAQAVRTLCESHGDVQWAIAIPDRCSNSIANPVHDFMTNQFDYPYLLSTIESETGSACAYVDLSNSDAQVYYQKYFRTDHHWQIDGAIDAYEKIMERFGKETLADTELFTAYKGPFFGSGARNGRCIDFSDSVRDVKYERNSLKIIADGVEQSESFLDSGYELTGTYKNKHRYDNVYASYFHSDPAIIEIRNESLPDGPTLLIVGDSYTNNIERLFAESYSTVFVIDPRNYKESLSGFVDNHGIDDAVLIVSGYTILNENAIAEISS